VAENQNALFDQPTIIGRIHFCFVSKGICSIWSWTYLEIVTKTAVLELVSSITTTRSDDGASDIKESCVYRDIMIVHN